MGMNKTPHLCPCCGYYLFEDGPGSFDICPICFWEDDIVQSNNPTYSGGVNAMSLNECRSNYREFGASEKRFIELVRKPTIGEIENAKSL